MKRSCKIGFLFLGLALLATLPGVAADAAQDKNQDRTLSPYFFVENGDPAVDKLPLKETRRTSTSWE
jgi:Ca-activated chloride channel homolog